MHYFLLIAFEILAKIKDNSLEGKVCPIRCCYLNCDIVVELITTKKKKNFHHPKWIPIILCLSVPPLLLPRQTLISSTILIFFLKKILCKSIICLLGLIHMSVSVCVWDTSVLSVILFLRGIPLYGYTVEILKIPALAVNFCVISSFEQLLCFSFWFKWTTLEIKTVSVTHCPCVHRYLFSCSHVLSLFHLFWNHVKLLF